MSRITPTLLISLWLSGCVGPVLETTFSDGGIWDFYLFDDPDATGDFVVLPEGTVAVRDTSGVLIDGAAIDSGDGVWRIDVEPGQLVDIVVSGPSHLPTVRRAAAPETSAQFSTPLHPRSVSILPPLMDVLAAVEELDVVDSRALLSGESAAMVVEPLFPEDWIDAELSLVDGAGIVSKLSTLSTLADGSYALAQSTPMDMILASDLTPGTITLSVQPITGPTVTQSWFLGPGELADGRYFALASEY